MAIKVIVVDDHRLFRHGLGTVLNREEDIDVIAEAADGREALAKLEALRPDVVTLDIAMPGMSGLIAIREMRKTAPNTKIVVLTMYLNQKFVLKALRSGASGYVVKESAVEELVTAIRTAQMGEIFLSPRVTSLAVKGMLQSVNDDDESVFEILSGRELEVLQLVVEGRSNREIAEVLYVSPKTVEKHRASIMKKLDVHDIPSLVRLSIRSGLIEP